MLVGRFCVFVTVQLLMLLANFFRQLRNRCLLGYLYVRPTAEENDLPKPCSPDQNNLIFIKSVITDFELFLSNEDVEERFSK